MDDATGALALAAAGVAFWLMRRASARNRNCVCSLVVSLFAVKWLSQAGQVTSRPS